MNAAHELCCATLLPRRTEVRQASGSGRADLLDNEDEIPEDRKTAQLVAPIVGEYSISSGYRSVDASLGAACPPVAGLMRLWWFRRGDIASQRVWVHGTAVLGT